jgi:predicted Rossmann fold nucleotide-binding protein DprA/Smf involved in DNA uptake
MRVLSAHPEHIDQVAAAAGLDVRETLVTLLELELRGLATALPGKRFILA